MKVKTLLLISFLCLISLLKPAAALVNQWPATDVHEALTSEPEWLNTARPLTKDDLSGRIILVDFWTYCCINCMQVMPELQKLEHDFGADLTVIGVHSAKFNNEKDKENIRSAILRYGLEHPVVNDSSFGIWKKFGINGWPTLLLISPDGRIKQVFSGEGHYDELKSSIKDLLQQPHRSDKLPLALEKDKAPKTTLSFPGKIAFGEYHGASAIFISSSGANEIVVANLDGKILAHIKGNFNKPQGILYDTGRLYIADTGNHELKSTDLASGKTEILAGNGERGNAFDSTTLASPWDLAFFPDKNSIAIANAGTHQIKSYDLKTHRISTIAGSGRESIGDGAYPDNALAQTSGLSASGDKLYFVDSETSSLRVLQGGKVKTLIGTGLFDFGYSEGKRGQGQLQHPLGVYADGDKIFITDSYNHSIRIYDVKSGLLKNFLGDGKRGQFNEPNDIKAFSGKFYIADTNNNRILVDDAGKISELHLSEGATEIIKPAKLDELPNLLKTKPIATSIIPKLILNLQKNWKINEEAPSYTNLFMDGKLVKSFDRAALKPLSIPLPKLQPGKYLLQGTIYYCQDKAGSQCLIGSFNQEITAAPDTKLDEVRLSF